jgi:hypothetical protein
MLSLIVSTLIISAPAPLSKHERLHRPQPWPVGAWICKDNNYEPGTRIEFYSDGTYYECYSRSIYRGSWHRLTAHSVRVECRKQDSSVDYVYTYERKTPNSLYFYSHPFQRTH